MRSVFATKNAEIGAAVLLPSLLIQLLVWPLFDGFPFAEQLFETLVTGTMVVAAASVVGSRVFLILAVSLAVLSLLADAIAGDVDPALEMIGIILSTALAALAASFLFRDIMFGHKDVTWALLANSMSIFLLFGFVYSGLYQMVWAQSGIMAELPAFLTSDADNTEFAAVYFSFVTLTTLGYGDVSPSTVIDASLALSEALLGQLYIAVVLARLVAMHLTGSKT